MDVEKLKHVIDASAAANVVAILAGWLPVIAAALSIISSGIQIYSWYKSRKS